MKTETHQRFLLSVFNLALREIHDSTIRRYSISSEPNQIILLASPKFPCYNRIKMSVTCMSTIIMLPFIVPERAGSFM